jgi:serine/threonine-protein kinase
MSPEQGAGGLIDGRSDIYSLGCVVFEMLSGEPPFTGPTPQAVIAKHMQAPIPSVRVVRSTVAEDTQQVLATALAKSPADRYSSAGEFIDALDASLSAASVHTRRRRTAVGGTAVVGLALALLLLSGGDDSNDEPGPSASANIGEPARVAVLYFDDLTPDSSLRHIADGLTEELIYELSGVNAFRVVSKGGVKQFRGRQVPFDSMVRVLGASTVVDGSLRRAGDEIRAMVQLIDARTNTYVDRISLQRPSSEFVTLQREVAQQVATALRRRLGREVALRREITGTNNSYAAELVLKARRAREDAAILAEHPHPEDRKSTLQTLDRADSILELAQAEDPQWLRPLLDRGWVAHQRVRLLRGDARLKAGERGLAYAREAVQKAPRNAEALELRGTLRWLLARDLDTSAAQSRHFTDAEADLRAALDQDSTRASAWGTLSWVLLRLGNFAEADLAAERALREDAYLNDARDIYERAFYSAVWNGNLSRADEWCSRGQLSFPGYWRFLECELTLLREDVTERADDARAWTLVGELERLYPADRAKVDGNPYNPIYWRMVAAAISARAGRNDVARAEIARARRAVKGDSALGFDLAYDEAYLRLLLGEPDHAEVLLRELIRARPGTRALLARDPLFRDLPLPWLRGPS